MWMIYVVEKEALISTFFSEGWRCCGNRSQDPVAVVEMNDAHDFVHPAQEHTQKTPLGQRNESASRLIEATTTRGTQDESPSLKSLFNSQSLYQLARWSCSMLWTTFTSQSLSSSQVHT